MKFAEMTAPEIRAAAGHTVAVLPLAATEQHGPHLPVSVDTALVSEVARRAEAALTDSVVLCPTLCFGSSHHHRGFGGTLSIGHTTYVAVLVDLVESLLQSDFRRIVLVNGHGGNITPGKQALGVLSDRHDDTLGASIALATYWELGGKAFSGAAPMETSALSHACEYETSMMLHVHPALVHLDRAQRGARPERNNHVFWEEDGPARGISMSKRTHFVSGNGSSGNPTLATAAKGEHLLNVASEALTQFLQEFGEWPFLSDLRANSTGDRQGA